MGLANYGANSDFSAQATKENRGSGNPNIELQKQEERDPNKSDARDRTGRKGGDNEEAL